MQSQDATVGAKTRIFDFALDCLKSNIWVQNTGWRPFEANIKKESVTRRPIGLRVSIGHRSLFRAAIRRYQHDRGDAFVISVAAAVCFATESRAAYDAIKQ